MRLFVPILTGATLRERAISCVGALLGISLTGLVCGLTVGRGSHLPLIVAPMGASAVLLFAVPSSPLAQPWSIIGGNTISALAGYLVAQVIHDPVVAAGAGVGLAIAAMSFTRSLHPPGGAAALTAVLGGPAVAKWGLLFPLVPVALNSCILVACGLLCHRLSRRSYPHVAIPNPTNLHGTKDPPPPLRLGFYKEDVDAAIAKLGETFDVSRDDIERILKEAELEAIIHSHHNLTCADIMSRDVIAIRPYSTKEDAVSLLLCHDIRVVPVTDDEGHLLGTVGQRELATANSSISDVLSTPVTASASSPAVGLLPILSDGRTHAIMITDPKRRLLGLISRSDMLSAIGPLIFGHTNDKDN